MIKMTAAAVITFTSNWYLVTRWTGLMRKEAMSSRIPNLFWISCGKERGAGE